MAEGRDQQEMQRRYQEIISEFDQVDQKLIRKVRKRCTNSAVSLVYMLELCTCRYAVVTSVVLCEQVHTYTPRLVACVDLQPLHGAFARLLLAPPGFVVLDTKLKGSVRHHSGSE